MFGGNRFDVESEKELIKKAQAGDLQARRQLHIVYKGLLDSIVYPRYNYSPQPVSAIRAEAEKLLDKCIDSWNPSFDNKPSSYINGYISKKLLRYVNENKQLVRTTERYAWKTNKFSEVLTDLRNKLRREPSDFELVNEMNQKFPEDNIALKDISRLRNELRPTTLSSAIIGDAGDGSSLTVGDLAFSSTEDPFKHYSMTLKARELNDKIALLPEPNKTIIKYHVGLDGYPQLSLRDIAVKLGLNKYRVQKVIDETKEMLQ